MDLTPSEQRQSELESLAAEAQLPQFPPIDPLLLDALEARWPDRAPHPKATEREIWISSGAIYLLRALRAEYERQQQDP